MSQTYRYALWGLIPIILIIDQVTKWMVLNEPRFNALGCLDRTQPCGKIELSPMFDLSMVWNRGVSFGTLQSEGVFRWILVAITLSIAIAFTIWLFRAQRKWTALALALVVGGAIGNVVDRIWFGAVVDFFDFSGPWFGLEIPLPGFLSILEWPFAGPNFRDGMLGVGFPWVFNVADAAITVGAVLLFIDQFLLLPKDDAADASPVDE